MSNHKSLPATLLLIAGLAASSLSGARADDKCLAKPNAPAPKGQHWYYRHDRAKHLCWYLREQGLPVSKHAPHAAQQPAPQAAAQSAAPPVAPPQAAPEAPATDGNFTTAAAPVPFLAAMDLAMTTSAARPAASRAADTSSQSASAGPLPVSARVTTGMGDPPPQAERRIGDERRRSAASRTRARAPAAAACGCAGTRCGRRRGRSGLRAVHAVARRAGRSRYPLSRRAATAARVRGDRFPAAGLGARGCLERADPARPRAAAAHTQGRAGAASRRRCARARRAHRKAGAGTAAAGGPPAIGSGDRAQHRAAPGPACPAERFCPTSSRAASARRHRDARHREAA